MLNQLTSPQLAELEAMWAIEGGWGDYKQDYRMGQLCAIHANINRDKKKRRQSYTSEDFSMRPKWKDATPDKTAKVRANLDMLATRKGKRKKK